MSSCKNLKYHLTSTKKIKLPVLTKPGQETQLNFPFKLQNKHVTGELYILIAIERYSKSPVIWVFISTEAKEVTKFLKSSINIYGVREKKNQKRVVLSYPKIKKILVKTKTTEYSLCPSRLRTGTEVITFCQFRRYYQFYRKHKSSFESDAIYHAYRIRSKPIWITAGKPRTELTNIVEDD